MTWTAESVLSKTAFYFGVVTWTGFSKTAPWIAGSLWTSRFSVSLLPETCWLCTLTPPEMGGIFLPNPCDFFSWIFHGGKAWRVPLSLFTCYANTCAFWGSPSLRKEGSCLLAWEGLTHDLGWKLCQPLAIVQPKLDGLNCLWLMCSHQSHWACPALKETQS